MYQPHPDRETLFSGNPSNLVAATQNVQTIHFDDLLEMRQVVWDLADLIAEWKPDLIPFFATGGIPYLFPAMHVLEKRKLRDLIDGQHFHLFPGLTWGGSIEGQNSETFFTTRFGDVVRKNLGSEPLRVLVIDTTNSGNAVNKAVAACQKAFEASDASSDSIRLTVVGIVNSSHAEAKFPSAQKSPVTGKNQTAYVLTPSGFSPSSTLVDRQFTVFSPLAPGVGFPFEVTYWLAGNIPTEDNAELIGVEAVHESLSTKSEPIAGRFKIVYGNGETQQGTGLGTLSARLVSLLSKPLESMPWQKMQAIHDLPPLSDEERRSLTEIKEESDGALRLFELEPIHLLERHLSESTDLVNGLMKIGRLLNDVEVYWLGTLDPTPRAIAPKVRASLEQGICTTGEAVKYFRRAFPELAAADPGGDASAQWWDANIRSMPREAFASNEQSCRSLGEDESEDGLDGSDASGADDEKTSSDDSTLDFVIIVGGVDEARKQLVDLKSKGMSLEEIENHLNATWPVTADKAFKFNGPTNEQAAMNFVLERGGWDEAILCLEKWITKSSGDSP